MMKYGGILYGGYFGEKKFIEPCDKQEKYSATLFKSLLIITRKIKTTQEMQNFFYRHEPNLVEEKKLCKILAKSLKNYCKVLKDDSSLVHKLAKPWQKLYFLQDFFKK